MTEVKRRKKKDGPRTEVFAMRLDPKLKYLAEVASRKQRRSLANFIEWAIELALNKVVLDEGQKGCNVLDEGGKLWDLEPSDRLLKLAKNYPDLMTYEEQVIWKAIQEFNAMWTAEDKTKTITFWFKDIGGEVDAYPVRKCWPVLVAYANGNASAQQVKDALIKLYIEGDL